MTQLVESVQLNRFWSQIRHALINSVYHAGRNGLRLTCVVQIVDPESDKPI